MSEVMTMPRTVQDILDHAGELAQRFEDYEPAPEDERDPRIYAALRDAVLSRSDAEREVRAAIDEAREHGYRGRSSGACSVPPERLRASATRDGRKRRPCKTRISRVSAPRRHNAPNPAGGSPQSIRRAPSKHRSSLKLSPMRSTSRVSSGPSSRAWCSPASDARCSRPRSSDCRRRSISPSV